MNNRDYSLDMVAGLLILHMLLGHIFQWNNLKDSLFYQWQMRALFFFMPWFFFKSGMFHKQTSFKKAIKKYNRSLLLPLTKSWLVGIFLFWINLFLIIHDHNWMHYIMNPIKNVLCYGNFVGNDPLWFLLTLYFTKVIYNALESFIKLEVIILINFIGTILVFYSSFALPSYIKTLPLAILFYSFGIYFVKKCKLNWKQESFIFILSIFQILFIPEIVDFHTLVIVKGDFFLWILFCVLAILGINSIFKKINISKENLFVKIGNSSMIIFAYHWPVIYFFSILNHWISLNVTYTFFLMLLSVILFVVLTISISWAKVHQP